MKKIRVLAFMDYYLPGYKGGGPIVSVSRIAQSILGSAEFFVVTRDRDLGDDSPYECQADAWTERPEARVWYASPGRMGVRDIRRVVEEVQPDVVYLNSFFSSLTRRVLLLRRLGLLRDVGVVMAPRGEFSPGALAIKSAKKRSFVMATRAMGLYRGLVWKPSTAMELREIKQAVGPVDSVTLAELPAPPSDIGFAPKVRGKCKFVFVSRVSRKKNVEFALEALRGVEGEVEFDVYGPFEDHKYESELRRLAERMPANVAVRFMGSIEPALVPGAFASGHFFLFPTHGENFGHVIAEAMAVGVPCVLSDQTPWSEVSALSAGWAVALADKVGWRTALQECVEMDGEEYAAMRGRVRSFYAAHHREAWGGDVLFPFEEARRCA